MFPPATAVGKIINWKAYTIAAVIRDYHHRSLGLIRADPLCPHAQQCLLYGKVAAGTAPESIPVIQALYKKLYPGNSYIYKPPRRNICKALRRRSKDGCHRRKPFFAGHPDLRTGSDRSWRRSLPGGVPKRWAFEKCSALR